MGRQADVREVRKRAHPARRVRQADALLVRSLPVLLLGPHRNPARLLQRPAPQVGRRHLPLPDLAQERIQHETPPGYRSESESRLVHAPPHPGRMEHRSGQLLLWPCGSGRNLRRGHRPEPPQAGPERPGAGWRENPGGRREGPGHESGPGRSGPRNRPEDATRLRTGERRGRCHPLHGRGCGLPGRLGLQP